MAPYPFIVRIDNDVHFHCQGVSDGVRVNCSVSWGAQAKRLQPQGADVALDHSEIVDALDGAGAVANSPADV